MAVDPTPVDYTPLSSTKQNRILIWRDEVAATALPDPASDSSSLAPSSSNASASTNNSSSNSSNAAASTGHNNTPNISRRARLWRKLSKKLRVSGLPAGPSALDLELKAREEVRTGMYRESWALEEAAREAAGQVEGNEEEKTGMQGKLGDMQERLERAERLLNQGVATPAA